MSETPNNTAETQENPPATQEQVASTAQANETANEIQNAGTQEQQDAAQQAEQEMTAQLNPPANSTETNSQDNENEDKTMEKTLLGQIKKLPDSPDDLETDEIDAYKDEIQKIKEKIEDSDILSDDLKNNLMTKLNTKSDVVKKAGFISKLPEQLRFLGPILLGTGGILEKIMGYFSKAMDAFRSFSFGKMWKQFKEYIGDIELPFGIELSSKDFKKTIQKLNKNLGKNMNGDVTIEDWKYIVTGETQDQAVKTKLEHVRLKIEDYIDSDEETNKEGFLDLLANKDIFKKSEETQQV